MRFGLLVLPHLIHESNDAENGKGEHHNHSQCYGPAGTIIQCLNKHHGAKNGKQDTGGKKWKLHGITICRWQK